MKKYIESQDEEGNIIREEVNSTTEILNGKEFNGVKLLNKTFTKSKETSAINKVKLKEKKGKVYKRRIHICNHEEGQPCIIENI